MDIEKVLRYGKKYGEVEAYLEKRSVVKVRFKDNSFENLSYEEEENLDVRITNKNKYGYATTSNLNNWKVAVDKANQNLKYSAPLKFHPELPKEQKYFDVERKKDIFNLTEDVLIDIGKEIIDKLNKARIKVTDLEVKKVVSSEIIANTSSLYGFDQDAYLSLSISVNYKDYMLFEEFNRREINFNKEIDELKEKVKLFRKSKKIDNFKGKALFNYWALADLFINFTNWIKANNVYYNKSPLSKIKIIGNEKINIVDNGLFPNGLYTSKFDGEGVSRKRTIVVEEGILSNLLYDSYMAQLEGTKSTGNAFSIKRRPSIEVSNLVIQKGNNKDLIKEVDKGILIEFLIGHSFPVTGDISTTIIGAYIEKGEIKHGIRNVVINCNFFNLLKNTVALGNEYRQDSYLIAPQILFDKVEFYQG